MVKTSGLLLTCIVAVALMAPPASSQKLKTDDRLDIIERDILDVKNAIKQMQDTSDSRNNEMKAVFDQILSRFSSIDSGFQKIEGSITSLKATNEATTRTLTEMRTTLNQMKTSVDALAKVNYDESLNNINLQISGLKRSIEDSNSKTVETNLPTAKNAFDNAFLEESQGFDDLAIADYKEFLATYPKDLRAQQAHIRLGGLYFHKKDFENALIEYDAASQNYGPGGNTCTALFKKGLTHGQLKQTAQAREALGTVVKECPDDKENAQAELRKLPTAARGGRGTNN